jgi:hypothetical protein
MRAELDTAVGDPAVVDAVLSTLAQDPLLLENAGLLVLSGAWSDEREREQVTLVLEDAKGKLPVLEIGLLALVAMYGMYLWRTGGVRRSEKTVERKADGSLVEHDIVEYTGPSAPLQAIVSLFKNTVPPA